MRREDRDELLRGFLAINAMLREETKALRGAIDAWRADETKQNPNWHLQPRLPRGVSGGGQWTDGGAASPNPRRDQPRRPTPRSTPRRALPRPSRGGSPASTPSSNQGVQSWSRALFRVSPLTLALPLYGDTPRPIVTTSRVAGTDDLWLVEVHIGQTDQRFAPFQRVVRPERRIPLRLFGVQTDVDTVAPPVLERLDVDVEIHNSEVWFDPDALATAYGRDVFGASASGATVAPITPEERRLDHNLREFLHATPVEISIAIQQLRNESADGEPFLRALREHGARDSHARRIRNSVRFQRRTLRYIPPQDGPLVDIFPALPSAPGGQSVYPATAFLSATSGVTEQEYRDAAREILEEIRSIDPAYQSRTTQAENLATSELGAHLDALRMERAALLWRTQQQVEPLQVEMLRFVQRQADEYYPRSLARYEAGELSGLNRNEAIGSDLDATIRRQLRELFSTLGLEEDDVMAVNRAVSVTRGNDRFPDLYIDDIFIDLSLDEKDSGTDQIIAFFEAKIPPRYVIVVKPRQIGRTSLITPPPRRYARD